MGHKIIFLIPIMIILSMLTGLEGVSARIPYPSYAYGPEGERFWIQTPYMPMKVIGQTLYTNDQSGQLTKTTGLKNPNDIYLDDSDNLYVADNANNRVVKFNDAGLILQEFGISDDQKAKLKNPEGVYVSKDGAVYVADTGNQRIVVYDDDGRYLKEYTKPDDVSLKNTMFSPIHIAIDARGHLFVVLKGSNEGIAIISPEGKFQGFFGRNVTEMTVLEKMKRKLYTEKQVATNLNREAASVSDLFIGNDGYIYTCTQNVLAGQIKKLNVKGIDMFAASEIDVNKVDIWNDNGTKGVLSIADITVDRNGIIYTLDRNNGMVFVYDNDGQVLASFGTKLWGNNYRIGSFGAAISIAVNSKGMIYVVDQTYNGIHVFQPTTFMDNVLTATKLFNDGEYLEALPYWEDILKKNTFYYKAHLGLGKIYYSDQQWGKSMTEMKLAYNPEYYSEAMWQLRVVWIQNHLNQIAGVVILLLMVMIVKASLKKRKLKAMKMRGT